MASDVEPLRQSNPCYFKALRRPWHFGVQAWRDSFPAFLNDMGERPAEYQHRPD